MASSRVSCSGGSTSDDGFRAKRLETALARTPSREGASAGATDRQARRAEARLRYARAVRGLRWPVSQHGEALLPLREIAMTQPGESVAPVLLDLFCGAGGATKGYQRAGFYVVGVDVEPQPNYCGDEFYEADALKFLSVADLLGFDAIHASPPCQFASALNRAVGNQASHENLIPPTRERLETAGLPYVIENVPDAWRELRSPALCCGAAFGLEVVRHRLFECSFPFMVPPCAHKPGGAADGTYVMFGGRSPRAPGRRKPPRAGEREWRDAAGLAFMSVRAARQGIPPRYTEHIGGYLMRELEALNVA
jgi:DNA (cytosine-5)-methyltransferase 1